MEAAHEGGTALEIYCQSNRMDLNDEQAMMAREKGAKLLMAADSHSLPDYNFMEIGVSIACRV